MNSLKKYSFVDLLPSSLTKDPFIVALAEAVENELKQVYRELEQLSNFTDVDKLPEGLLDYLAYQRHVDFYEFDLPAEQKRELIKTSIAWHRKKGTAWAVEKVASIVFPSADVLEWFDYDGDPYRFKVEVEEPFIASKDIRRLNEVIEATKNKRSHLDSMAVKTKEQAVLVSNTATHGSYPLLVTNTFHSAVSYGKGFDGQASISNKVVGATIPLLISNTFYTC